MEHRWGKRRPLTARVRIFGPGQLCAIGWLTDISVSGTYVRTLATLATMSRIVIEVEGHHSGGGPSEPLQLRGRVVRQGPGGVGVEWEEFASWQICGGDRYPLKMSKGSIFSTLRTPT